MKANCVLCYAEEDVDDWYTIVFCSSCTQILLKATPEAIRRGIISAENADRHQLASALYKYLLEDDDGLQQYETKSKTSKKATSNLTRNMDRKRVVRKTRFASDKGRT